jgi:hypothetical protein
MRQEQRQRWLAGQIQNYREGRMTDLKTNVGYGVQLGGIVALAIGAVLSVHHLAVGATLLGGAAALYIGQKIRSVTL